MPEPSPPEESYGILSPAVQSSGMAAVQPKNSDVCSAFYRGRGLFPGRVAYNASVLTNNADSQPGPALVVLARFALSL
ncbi:hypothetical protein cypCar_00039218 [Cyprinus carpio]|nr:hypothetical protein cypCar_00039218 [Cyprinus carpio]